MATDIGEWLEGLGLGKYAEAFAENAVDLDVLGKLDADDLKEIGIPLGDRKRLLAAIGDPATPTAGATAPTPLPAQAEAERRQLTVMFVDLVGSTAIAEQLDPEDYRNLIRRYQEACAAVVGRFEGYISKYLGDGIMVYFGYPRAHEDDAERAVRAGLEIVEAISGIKSDPALRARIGIATGLVVAGDMVGNGIAEERAVLGETPNLAARLEALAEPNNVVIAPATHRLTSGAFDYADLGSHALKGFSEPVRAWRVTGARVTESRFEAARGARLTELVGREAEIALLEDRWRQAKTGSGQVVLLSGEAGIGKSRITQVLRQRIADQPHTRLRYQCSPYNTNSAAYPIITQLERAAGFVRGDDGDAKLAKLEALLGQSAADLYRVAPLFATLLALPANRYPPLNFSPERQRQETIAALADQVAALADNQPVLLIFEDAHWIDPTSVEALGAVIDRIADAAVLAVITYRPEFEPPWADRGHAMVHTLARLGPDEGADLVAKVTGGKALPQEVLDQIVAKTDGVPLFVEELTKTVLEAGFLKAEEGAYVLDGPLPPLAIPATLQDSLTARLDRLSPVKEVAQIGACIGRAFAYELIAAVSPLRDNELQDALQQLVNSELISRRGTTWTFKHALVQDAAYESLLKSRRQQIHGCIAGTLQESFPELCDHEPELLAHHYQEASQYLEAVRYWELAGQKAGAALAATESTRHFANALALVRNLDKTDDRNHTELRVRTALATVSVRPETK